MIYSVIDQLLLGMLRFNFLDLDWLRIQFNQWEPKYDKNVAGGLRKVFPELPFSPTWLAQAWALYACYARLAQPEPMRNDIGFLYFILGLKAGWPRNRRFTESTWRVVMKEGEKRARQILTILYIFHTEDA
ncbi:hypothetical protein CS8_029970 [Cupriavidus sp. 8B]